MLDRGLFAFPTFLMGFGIKHLLRTGYPNYTELYHSRMTQHRLLLLGSVASAVVSDSLEREECLRKRIHNTDYALKASQKLTFPVTLSVHAFHLLPSCEQ